MSHAQHLEAYSSSAYGIHSAYFYLGEEDRETNSNYSYPLFHVENVSLVTKYAKSHKIVLLKMTANYKIKEQPL
jgi:hypothetical protein